MKKYNGRILWVAAHVNLCCAIVGRYLARFLKHVHGNGIINLKETLPFGTLMPFAFGRKQHSVYMHMHTCW